MKDGRKGKPDGSQPGAGTRHRPQGPTADRDPPLSPGGPQSPGPGSRAGPKSRDERPPGPGGPRAPDPDAARNAADQRSAQQAGALRDAVFPSLMASALGLDGLFESKAYKVYLERLIEDAGNPADPIERMILEQIALAHFRIGQLHVKAGLAEGIEAVKVYNSVAARMLGEFRRTTLALRVYQAGVPKGEARKRLKIHKLAQ